MRVSGMARSNMQTTPANAFLACTSHDGKKWVKMLALIYDVKKLFVKSTVTNADIV